MKLLVIRLGALGDLLHVSASLAALKAAMPQVEVHFLTSPAYESLAAAMSGVDRVRAYDKQAGWRGLFAMARALKAEGYDAVVNLHPSLKTHLLTRLAGIRRHAVYAKQKMTVTGKPQRTIPRLHATQDFFRPFRQLLDLPDALTPPRLPVPGGLLPKPAEEQWIGLIIGVGGKRGNRAWPLDAYETLIPRLLEVPNRRILLIGGPEEAETGQALHARLGLAQVENHCGMHSILDTARLLSQCNLVVGGDTGPLHLAAAVEAPIVALYGPTAISRTGPAAWHSLQALTPPASLDCWPCELAQCPLPGEDYLACMRQISPVETHYACETLLVAQEPEEISP